MNPPFPYQVIISRLPKSKDPFTADLPAVEIYKGECDLLKNRFPNVKNGVTVGKYNLYIPGNSICFQEGDLITFSMCGRIDKGILVDYQLTNLGTTIQWDKVGN